MTFNILKMEKETIQRTMEAITPREEKTKKKKRKQRLHEFKNFKRKEKRCTIAKN